MSRKTNHNNKSKSENKRKEDIFSRKMRSMRNEFSRLINQDPESFQKVVDEYLRLGPSGFTKGKVRKNAVPEEAQAFLLARYKTRGKQTKEKFISQTASKGWNSKDRFSEVLWSGESSIQTALRKSLSRYKTDEEFRDRVDFIVYCFETPR